MSVCQTEIRTPKGLGRFDVNKIPKSDILLLESLYCLPFAKKYKETNDCKIISMIVDTSFWIKKLSVFRKLYYKMYLDSVDAFITLSERSKKDIGKYMKANGFQYKPIIVVRPFLANNFRKKINLTRNILFIGNAAREKGYIKLVKAMEHLPEFDLYLVGNCCKDVKKFGENVHLEGRVSSLAKYFQLCTYYVHPADFEPFGVAPLEAMYSSLIPILTKEVGVREIFTKKLERIVLSDNDPGSIARKIIEIDSLQVKKKIFIIKECRRIANQYTKEKNIKLFKKEFYKLSKII